MPADLVARFMQRATDMASTVERVDSRSAIPAAVARYLDALDLPPELAAQKSHAGVCWPEFADLDWRGAGLAIEARPTLGHDRLAITGAFCAIAETGTLVLTTGRGHADRVGTAAGHAHRRGPRRKRGLGYGRSVRAGPLGKWRHAACDEHDFRSVAHRRHRTDHRARRAWAVSRPSAAAWLNHGVPRRAYRATCAARRHDSDRAGPAALAGRHRCARRCPTPSRNATAWLAGLTTLAGCALLGIAAPAVFGGEILRVSLPWFADVAFGFRMDGLAWAFALVICRDRRIGRAVCTLLPVGRGSSRAVLSRSCSPSWAPCSASCWPTT